ncbi:MAG: hypothetical protein ABR538_05090 [Candidatus Binatia bacterium]
MNLFDWRRFGAAFVSCLALLALQATSAAAARQAFAEEAAAVELRHGSRATAKDGTLVVYDKVTGVYRVPGRESTYWTGERFFQYDNGLWQTADAIAGPWRLAAVKEVPEVAAQRPLPPRNTVTTPLPSGQKAVYEPLLKAYKVVGLKGIFLVDARYYRYEGGIWLGGDTEEGPWSPASNKAVPPPLRKAVPKPAAGDKVTLPGGEVLVFEERSGLFTLEGKPDTVLFDGAYYERRGDKWLTSKQSASGFEEVESSLVPPPVRANYHLPSSERAAKAQAKKAKAAKSAKEKTVNNRPTRDGGNPAVAKPAGKKAGPNKAGDAKPPTPKQPAPDSAE